MSEKGARTEMSEEVETYIRNRVDELWMCEQSSPPLNPSDAYHFGRYDAYMDVLDAVERHR